IGDLKARQKEFTAAGEKAAGWLMQTANNKIEEARLILGKITSKSDPSKPVNDEMNPAMKLMQDAISLAMVATEVAPENAGVWHLRGDVYYELIGAGEGVDGWALKMYEKALELDADYAPSWNDIGRVYLKTDNLAKAKEAFDKAIALDGDYIDPHYYLVLINEREGNDDDTVAELEKLSAMVNVYDTKAQNNIKEAILRVRGGKPLSSDFNSEK
ncbi:MAG: tetratricopeptide repeat protein, partial [Candidatus Pacebacteria bacterium]|nr:tetratricopeptide repeat protein [Candidatus Paceibacterota bacterium]